MSEELIAHVVSLIEHKARSAIFLEFLQCIVCVSGKEICSSQEKVALEVRICDVMKAVFLFFFSIKIGIIYLDKYIILDLLFF